MTAVYLVCLSNFISGFMMVISGGRTTRLLKSLVLAFFEVKMEWRERCNWKKILLFWLKLLFKVILTNVLISEEKNMNGLNITDKET